jgi:hypothetical protein
MAIDAVLKLRVKDRRRGYLRDPNHTFCERHGRAEAWWGNWILEEDQSTGDGLAVGVRERGFRDLLGF